MAKKRSAKTPRPDDEEDFDAYDFLGGPECAADVDPAFAALSHLLPAPKFRAAVDAIEEAMIDMLKEDLKENGLEEVTENIKDLRSAPDPQDLEEALIFAQTVFNILKVKGAKADPLTKVFAREIAQLSDEEYNTIEGQTRASIAMAEAAADQLGGATALGKPDLVPNPFREQMQPPPRPASPQRPHWPPPRKNFKL